MKYEDIKDFNQRCDEHPDHREGMISYQMIVCRLHEEIEELRAYIEGKPAQEPTLQEQLAIAQAVWNKAKADWCKADAEIIRILKLMEKNNGT